MKSEALALMSKKVYNKISQYKYPYPHSPHTMKYIISLGVILGAYQFGKYTQSDTAAWIGIVAFLGLVMVVACKALLTSIIAKMPHA